MASPPEITHPPTGTPEYDSWAAQDKGPSIVVTCWVFTALATLFVIARVFVRMRLYSSLQSDDYWCLGGLVCGYLSTAFSTTAVNYGNGKHWNFLSQYEQERVILWTTVAFCPGVMCFGLPKFAVVRLLTRLLNPAKLHRLFLWFLAIWCLLTLGATIGTLLGQCTPAESQWNFDMKGTCVEKKHIINFSIYAGAYSAFVDVYLAVYPAIVLFNLQLKLQKKIALCIALGIGCVSGAVALYKTTRIPSGLGSPDFSYDSSDLVIWTVIEGSAMIIACTIPVLAPLMDMFFKRSNPFRSSSRRKTKYYEQYNDYKNPQRDVENSTGSTLRRPRATHTTTDWNDTVLGGESDSQELVPCKLGATQTTEVPTTSPAQETPRRIEGSCLRTRSRSPMIPLVVGKMTSCMMV